MTRPARFTVWTGRVAKGCGGYFGVLAVFDLVLFDAAGNKITEEKVQEDRLVHCPTDNGTAAMLDVSFQGKASFHLYVHVNLTCAP
jgi:hypothetical protein